jgi:hypothetical protein
MDVPFKAHSRDAAGAGSLALMQPMVMSTHAMIPEYRERCQFLGLWVSFPIESHGPMQHTSATQTQMLTESALLA